MCHYVLTTMALCVLNQIELAPKKRNCRLDCVQLFLCDLRVPNIANK